MSERRSTSLLRRDVQFPELYRALAARWFWLPLAIIIGGLIAMTVAFFLPTSYRATASLGIAIDYGRTHSLDEAAERVALLQVQGVLLSDDTLEEAIQEVPAEVLERAGVSGPADLRTAVRLDRFENRWDLSADAPDPQDAAVLANRWAEAGVVNLRQAVEHAVRARALQSQIYELDCGLKPAEATGEAVWRCELGQGDAGQELPDALVREVQASHGVPPGLSFALLRRATPPADPLYGRVQWLVLGGALVGLALGLILMLLVPAPAERK